MLIDNPETRKYIDDIVKSLQINMNLTCTIKGSYSRKVKYPPDVDMECNSWRQKGGEGLTFSDAMWKGAIGINVIIDQIYKTILKNIEYIKYINVDFIRIGCGFDERFDMSNEKNYEKIFNLLTSEDIKEIDKIKNTYSDNNIIKFFTKDYIERKYHRIKFSKEEILKNGKNLPGGIYIKFTEKLLENTIFKIKYSIWVKDMPFGIDMAILYPNIHVSNSSIKYPATYYYYYANYKKEYYYLLMFIRNFFKINCSGSNRKKKINKQLNTEKAQLKKKYYCSLMIKINDVIEIDYGVHKQLIEEIKLVTQLCKYKTIDDHQFNTVCKQISHDCNEIGINIDFEFSLTGLIFVRNSLENYVNEKCKSIFFNYLSKIPEKYRSSIYLI